MRRRYPPSIATTYCDPATSSSIRDAAYTFPPRSDGPRPKRVENGQIAVIDAVDAEKDTVRLLVREPGAEPRLVEIDQARLRAEHAAGKRAAAVRLAYAMHSFPAQGATVQGTATLAGHWSQAKRETYVGDTRAIYRHTVHVAREDLGVDGTDEDRIARYAQRIAENRQRLASIRSALDPTLKLAADLPAQEPIPGLASVQPCRTQLPAPARASSDTRRDPLPGRSATRRARPRRTVLRMPSRPARRTGSSSSSGRDRRSGSLASGGSARPGDSRHCRAAAHTRRPAASSPQSPPPRRLRARPGPPRRDSRRRSPAARRSGGEPSRGLLLGLGYMSRGKVCARHTAPSESESDSATAGVGGLCRRSGASQTPEAIKASAFTPAAACWPIERAASTARSRTCASSPKQSARSAPAQD